MTPPCWKTANARLMFVSGDSASASAVGDHGALLVLGDDGRWLAARKRLETAAYLAAALPMADGGLVVAGGGVLLRLRGEDL